MEVAVAATIAGGIAGWAWLRERGPLPIVYGLVALVCLLWLFDRFGWGPSTATKIREALDLSGFPFRRVPDPNNDFHFEVSEPGGGAPIHIYKPHFTSIVNIEARLVASKENRPGVNQLLVVELLRFGVAFAVEGGSVTLVQHLHVTRDLIGRDLLDRVFNIRTASNLVIRLLRSGLTLPMRPEAPTRADPPPTGASKADVVVEGAPGSVGGDGAP